jgi:hypothetical protein
MLTRTIDRVPANTPPQSNARIRRQIEGNIAYFARHPNAIPRRLEELEREWDIERVLETMSAGFSLGGLLLSIAGRRRWLLLTLAVQGFFLQHALQGWCPPLPLLRRIGIRTAQEVEEERYALLQILDEFDHQQG